MTERKKKRELVIDLLRKSDDMDFLKIAKKAGCTENYVYTIAAVMGYTSNKKGATKC